MYPAFSVIFFTTATGAGYGLLALAGVAVAFGALQPDRLFGFVTLGLALALITAGLLSSTFHLGRPERAWRSLSQWRSSWLSREGVVAILTYLPAAIFGVGWVILGRFGGIVTAAGLLAAAGALLTVFTTGMIYASLKPIPAWHNSFTAPLYLISSLMSGAVLFHAILRVFGERAGAAGIVAALAIALGWGWKLAAWRNTDANGAASTLNSATGLKGGDIRSVEWPHTEENYVLKEMGYRVARKHAARLRAFTQLFAFAAPLAATLVALAATSWLGTAAALIAVLAQVPGLLVERWLFFAEAKHNVTIYYGR